MFESLSEKLDSVFKKLKGKGLITEGDVDVALKEVRVALLEADVNYKVVKDFVRRLREKAVGKEVLESLTPGQQVVKIVHNELVELLGGTTGKVHLAPNPPTVFMLVGLQGSGKTTTAAKIANIYKGEGRRPMLVAADLQRPAAIEQLITLGEQTGVPVYHAKTAKDPVAVCSDSIKEAKREGRDIVIFDTAGRLHIDEPLMEQLRNIKAATEPNETLFVADAMTGQDAVNVASKFNESLGIDGVVLTKMDGDARGGAALSIRQVTDKPIKFIGVGEKIDALESFHPDRIASSILGMGDVLTLIEKAEKEVDEKEARELQEKIMSESFTFEDLRDQLRKLRNMGPLENLLSMIPGMNKLKGVKVEEKELVKVEAIIDSMTPAERRNVNLLKGSRKRRIANGSGTTPADVNRVIKQYLQMQKMLKMFKKKGRMPSLMPF
jgi:signal recognition particle subunit SRP54